MSSEISRREFLSRAGLAALALPLASWAGATPASYIGAVPGMKIGYAAITWGGNDLKAINEISSLGFRGIQLRANVVKDYAKKQDELWQLLKKHKLELCMLSSGNANINTGNNPAVVRQHLEHARFVEAVGGQHIQVTNSSRPKEGAPTTEDLKNYGRLLNEIGKRTLDIGIQTNYHNHMHQLGETPEEVSIIMDNCSEENVKLLLDIAHYHQGGGDPAQAIRKYRGRISSLHLKDVRPKAGGEAGAYEFVELGQGDVDLTSVFSALQAIKFKGWGIVELDSVPDETKTPLECARTSHTYLKSVGIKI